MTKEITKALVAFHQNVGTIHKTAKSYTNQYAPLDEVLSVVTPALSAQGLTFTHTFEPGAEGSEPILICTLLHTSGETLESRLPLVVAKGKNATQDLGSAITYLKRYTLLAMLGLVADVDTDGNVEAASAPAAKPKVAKLTGRRKSSARGKTYPPSQTCGKSCGGCGKQTRQQRRARHGLGTTQRAPFTERNGNPRAF